MFHRSSFQPVRSQPFYPQSPAQTTNSRMKTTAILLFLAASVSCEETTDELTIDSRAASMQVNCACQCSNLQFRDKYGKLNGNCQSADISGALWCYVDPRYSRCSDLKKSDRVSQLFSYEACATPELSSRLCQGGGLGGFINGVGAPNGGLNTGYGSGSVNGGINTGYGGGSTNSGLNPGYVGGSVNGGLNPGFLGGSVNGGLNPGFLGGSVNGGFNSAVGGRPGLSSTGANTGSGYGLGSRAAGDAAADDNKTGSEDQDDIKTDSGSVKFES